MCIGENICYVFYYFLAIRVKYDDYNNNQVYLCFFIQPTLYISRESAFVHANRRRITHLPNSSKNQQHPTQPQQHSIDLTLWGSNVRISRWRVRRRTWGKTASTCLSNQHPSHTTTSLQLTHLISLPTLLFRRRITRTKRLLPTLRHAS
jgi:hypothetical protein